MCCRQRSVIGPSGGPTGPAPKFAHPSCGASAGPPRPACVTPRGALRRPAKVQSIAQAGPVWAGNRSEPNSSAPLAGFDCPRPWDGLRITGILKGRPPEDAKRPPGRSPLECVFAYFLHKQKVGRRRPCSLILPERQRSGRTARHDGRGYRYPRRGSSTGGTWVPGTAQRTPWRLHPVRRVRRPAWLRSPWTR